MGRKGALVTVWCVLRVQFRQALIYSRCEHTEPPYGRYGTRRLLRDGQICEQLPLNICGELVLRLKFAALDGFVETS